MKLFHKTVIEIISTLFIISFFTINTYSQFNNFNIGNGNVNNYKIKIPYAFNKDSSSQNNLNHYIEINSLYFINMLNLEYHIDSIVSKSYSSEFQKIKNILNYNEDGKLTEFLSEYYNNGVHGFLQNFHLEYTLDGKLKSMFSLIWVGGRWINYYQENYLYDPSGNNIRFIRQEWDSTQNSWVNSELFEYSYNSNNNKILSLREDWINGAWENYSKKEFEFDTENNKIKEIYSRWSWGNWQFDSQTYWIFDSNNNLISETDQIWNFTTSVWENYSIEEYDYDENNQLVIKRMFEWDNTINDWKYKHLQNYFYTGSGKLQLEIKDVYDGNIWEKEYENLFEYDANDNLIIFSRSYNWVGLDWTSKNRWKYIYDNENRCIGGFFETWFSNHWVSSDIDILLQPEFWVNPQESIFWWFYSTIGYEFKNYHASVVKVKKNKNNNPTNYLLSQNYPNPFNPRTQINYRIPNVGFIRLKVYDALGKEIATLISKQQLPGNYKIHFNSSHLPSGVYYYRLTVSPLNKTAINFKETKKMINLK